MQLIWKLFLFVVTLIATSQICNAKSKNLPRDDEERFARQLFEDDIATEKPLNEFGDFRKPSRPFDIRDFEEERQLPAEDDDRRTRRRRRSIKNPTLTFSAYRGKRATNLPSMHPVRANELEGIVKNAIRQNKYFYIGYTSKPGVSSYLKTTTPKSKEWKNKFNKQETYYADLRGSHVTERELIDRYCRKRINGRYVRELPCVNGPTAPTKTNSRGIVYVLIGQKVENEEKVPSCPINRSKRPRTFRDVLGKISHVLRLNQFQ